MVIIFLYLFLAISVSFLCSIMEAVLLSTPISFLEVKESEGKKTATVFKRIKTNIDRPIAAILTLNTIAHTVGSAGVGAQATKVFGDAYFGIISAILTLLILVFSEILPKTIGAAYWRELSMVSGRIIRIMIFITFPFVLVSEYMTKWFSGSKMHNTISREEISVLAKIGTSEGVFEEKENKIIQNLLRLKTIKIESIMTPRVVVSLADEEMSLEEFLKNKTFLHYSRIPVFFENQENITGYVFRQLVFEKLAEDMQNMRLRDLKRDIVVVPGSQTVIKVWELLLEKKEHIALVVDEYGGVDGIVTMEDIIETLIGLEIVDETDRVMDMQQFARERWKERKAKYINLEKLE